MKPIIVSDAGPLIALAKLECLGLLPHLFSRIYIPQTVFKEATKQQQRLDAQAISHFVPQHCQLLDDLNNEFSRSLEIQLDKGEIQAISHARVLHCGVLMDEKRGRQIATHHKVATIGVIGVLIQAKKLDLMNEIKPSLLQLQDNGYRLSKSLFSNALILAGE